MVDARDLKSLGLQNPCRFESGSRHHEKMASQIGKAAEIIARKYFQSRWRGHWGSVVGLCSRALCRALPLRLCFSGSVLLSLPLRRCFQLLLALTRALRLCCRALPLRSAEFSFFLAFDASTCRGLLLMCVFLKWLINSCLLKIAYLKLSRRFCSMCCLSTVCKKRNSVPFCVQKCWKKFGSSKKLRIFAARLGKALCRPRTEKRFSER